MRSNGALAFRFNTVGAERKANEGEENKQASLRDRLISRAMHVTFENAYRRQHPPFFFFFFPAVSYLSKQAESAQMERAAAA